MPRDHTTTQIVEPNLSLAITYPNAKILTITCPMCQGRGDYAVIDEDRMVKCRHCGKITSLRELYELDRGPMGPLVENNSVTLNHVAASVAQDAIKRCGELRDEYRRGMMT